MKWWVDSLIFALLQRTFFLSLLGSLAFATVTLFLLVGLTRLLGWLKRPLCGSWELTECEQEDDWGSRTHLFLQCLHCKKQQQSNPMISHPQVESAMLCFHSWEGTKALFFPPIFSSGIACSDLLCPSCWNKLDEWGMLVAFCGASQHSQMGEKIAVTVVVRWGFF